MKTKLAILLLITFICHSQKKKEWYFGAEIGQNKISSFSFNENNSSVQFGLLSEYYFSNDWSVDGRLKYFKTGVIFLKYSGSLGNTTTDYNKFEGAVIAIPVTVKWNYEIYKQWKGYLKFGIAYNYEIQSDYEFSSANSADNSKSFVSVNMGLGLNYIFSKKTIFFIDLEYYRLGGYKGHNNAFLFETSYYTTNDLISIGIKHCFKK